jgi:lysophospholipase L1-like esterase
MPRNLERRGREPDAELTIPRTWDASQGGTAMTTALHVADRGTSAFQAARLSADVVCAGDSITGWNNFGAVRNWPYPTYPDSLQRLCEPSGLVVANGGIAGEVSPNGLGQVRDYLELFPNARYFVVGYGTNDLGMWPGVERTSPRIIGKWLGVDRASPRIIGNLDRMVRAIREVGRQTMLLNVPYANESMFPPSVAGYLHRMRDYHNERLGEYCRRDRVPLAEIASKLRDEHFADELHPNEAGAQVIAGEVYRVLSGVLEAEKSG